MGTFRQEQVVHGEPMPVWLQRALWAHVGALARSLEKQYGFSCRVEQSKKSEAVYLKMRSTNNLSSVIVSFRNHTGSESRFDYAIWISNYGGWLEMKQYFLDTLLPQIQEKLDR